MTIQEPAYPKDFAGVLGLIARLRGPQGCPWDREQTRDSLKRQFLEEVYEVLEAMEREDHGALAEELGDVFLHLAFQVQIAQERGEFTAEQLFGRLIEKLVRRHPHVFAGADASTARQVEANWEELKRQERVQSGSERSALEGVPKQMPALSYAQAIQVRAARVGFDWQRLDGLLDKLAEEVAEVRGADSDSERERELGDLLFTIVNICRWLGADAEGALRKASTRFYRRFAYMEEMARRQGAALADMPLDQKEALWQQAKRLETSGSST